MAGGKSGKVSVWPLEAEFLLQTSEKHPEKPQHLLFRPSPDWLRTPPSPLPRPPPIEANQLHSESTDLNVSSLHKVPSTAASGLVFDYTTVNHSRAELAHNITSPSS